MASSVSSSGTKRQSGSQTPAAKRAKQGAAKEQAITLTFCECGENHPGMQKVGQKAACGFDLDDLRGAQTWFERRGCITELVDLVAAGRVQDHADVAPAAVLLVRGGVNVLLQDQADADALMAEQQRLVPDKKFLDRRRQRVLNKRARWNLCFANEAQVADYEAGKGTIVAFDAVPLMAAVREILPEALGDRARNMVAEGNYYYDAGNCGIGFHGDGERSRVVGIRLGASMPLHFQWFENRKEPIGERVRLMLHHGDLYVMSEKAVGRDARRRLVPVLRHAAGAPKYLN